MTICGCKSSQESAANEDGSISILSFKTLSANNVWDWYNSQEISAVDSGFISTYLKEAKGFVNYDIDYQRCYIIDSIQTNNLSYIVIAQWIMNGDESYMYLCELNENSSIDKILLVSELYKSPTDYYSKESSIKGNKVERISINRYEDYENEDVYHKDSIIEIYDLSTFARISYDSINIK